MKLYALLFTLAGLSVALATSPSKDPFLTKDIDHQKEQFTGVKARASLDSPAPPTPGSVILKQATRKEVVRSSRRGAAKRQTSAVPSVCVPDTTPATTTPKYAVFDNIDVYFDSGSYEIGKLGSASSDSACAMICDNNANSGGGCAFAATYGSNCYGFYRDPSETYASGVESALYQNVDCATIKAEYSVLASNSCCNLYY